MFKFGTGGWRAIIGDDFIKSNICLVAQCLARLMAEQGSRRMVVGYDKRFLSKTAAQWFAQVMAANDIQVELTSKPVPTPLVMFWVREKGYSYGAMITASHNPAEYNGIKIFTKGGLDASPDVTGRLEQIAAQEIQINSMDFEQAVTDKKIEKINPQKAYISSVNSFVDRQAMGKNPLKILFDPMYGVSAPVFSDIFNLPNITLDCIHTETNPGFGGTMPSPSRAALGELRDRVLDGGYDIGLATDGDGDRLGIIDPDGNFVHPNQILLLIYYYLIEYKGLKGDVVRNLATTHILDKVAAHFGFECHQVPVGFKHISSTMERTDALLGGESSGGLTMRGHIKGKDGAFAAALFVEMLCATGKTVAQLQNEVESLFGKAEMLEYEYHYSAQVREHITRLVFEDKALPMFDLPVERVDYMDGCKVCFENGGWVLVRFSGTEPLIRIFCEMPDVQTAQSTIDRVVEFLKG